jgi:hypothetical protein
VNSRPGRGQEVICAPDSFLFNGNSGLVMTRLIHPNCTSVRVIRPFLLAATWGIGLRLSGPDDTRKMSREVTNEIARVILRTEYERRLSSP